MERLLAGAKGFIFLAAAVAGIAALFLNLPRINLFPEPQPPTVVIATSTLTPTPQPTYTPPPGAAVLLHDSLSDNSQGHGWGITNGNEGTCAFADGGYVVSAPTNGATNAATIRHLCPPTTLPLRSPQRSSRA